MHKLVLIRHGQSTWNMENRFTGWTDVDLTVVGEAEAASGGLLLAQGGYEFDIVYTSVLKRAIRTMAIVTDVLDQMWVPVTRAWQLNERHYGDLQGLNKAEMTRIHGEAKVLEWRRSYDIPPPPLSPEDPRYPGHDRRYSIAADRLLSLGWAPRKSFEEGMAETVAWYRDRRDWWEPLKSGEHRTYYTAMYAKRLAEAEQR